MSNPYDDHPNLSPLESQVLWEYAKLAHHLRVISTKSRLLTQQPLLANLRTLEKKMGLVLTLVRISSTRCLPILMCPIKFKASVWGVINEQPDPINP